MVAQHISNMHITGLFRNVLAGNDMQGLSILLWPVHHFSPVIVSILA